jgi:hypothetical protein
MKSEEFPAWLHLPNELRVRCRNCGTWKSFKVDISKYKPTPEMPKEDKCDKCGHVIKIDRVWFARKGMKKPKEGN